MAKVSVIGMGNVGTHLALELLRNGGTIKELALVNRNPNLGRFKDLLDSSCVYNENCRRHTKVNWSSDYSVTAGSNVIVITAGVARKEGMLRRDLLHANKPILEGIFEQTYRYNQKSNPIIIVATNPVDAMAHLVSCMNDFEKGKVIGLGGTLDGARLTNQISERTGISPRKIRPVVVGEHGQFMVVVPELTLVNDGVARTKAGNAPLSLAQLVEQGKITQKTVDEIISATVKRGGTIVKELGTSAYLAPAAALKKMIEGIVNNSGEIVCASTYMEDAFGEKKITMGVPVRLYRKGVEIVGEWYEQMSEGTRANLKKAADEIREIAEEMKKPARD